MLGRCSGRGSKGGVAVRAGLKTVQAIGVNRARTAVVCAFIFGASAVSGAQTAKSGAGPQFGKFIELPCGGPWGVSQDIPQNAVKCGTVTVPQDRRTPNDPRLVSVVLPVVIYAMPGATGTPVVFLAGGPGESSINALQAVLLKTPIGQSLLRDRPIIAFDRRGYSPVFDRATPDLGTVTFEPRANRGLAIAPLADTLARLAKDFRAHGIEPRNFTTLPAVEDIADIVRALHLGKVVLFGASYGTHEALQFMRLHPDMVTASVLDGVAPPSATQILDSAYTATVGQAILKHLVEECRIDSVCAAQYADLDQAVAALSNPSGSPLHRTAHFPVADGWRTIDVIGASVLTVLGIASSSAIFERAAHHRRVRGARHGERCVFTERIAGRRD